MVIDAAVRGVEALYALYISGATVATPIVAA